MINKELETKLNKKVDIIYKNKDIEFIYYSNNIKECIKRLKIVKFNKCNQIICYNDSFKICSSGNNVLESMVSFELIFNETFNYCLNKKTLNEVLTIDLAWHELKIKNGLFFFKK